MARFCLTLVLGLVGFTSLQGQATVAWVDWRSGSEGASGSASGVITAPGGTIDVSFGGQLAFLQTGGGTNYWMPSGPYVSSLIANPPPDPDLLAFSDASTRTLIFSTPAEGLVMAIASLNSNAYIFDRDFVIVSSGQGYWGSGTFTRTVTAEGFVLTGSGDTHGVIAFLQPVSTLTWRSTAPEYWNGITVGVGPVVIPEPATLSLMALGLFGLVVAQQRRG